jgi:hypothetical protein
METVEKIIPNESNAEDDAPLGGIIKDISLQMQSVSYISKKTKSQEISFNKKKLLLERQAKDKRMTELQVERLLKKAERKHNRAKSAYNERKHVLRPMSRAMNLLLGFLKGTPYKVVENKVRKDKLEQEPVFPLVSPFLDHFLIKEVLPRAEEDLAKWVIAE